MSLNFLKQDLVVYCKKLYGSQITETLVNASTEITEAQAKDFKKQIKEKLLADENFTYVSKNIKNLKHISLEPDIPKDIKGIIKNSFIERFSALNREIILEKFTLPVSILVNYYHHWFP